MGHMDSGLGVWGSRSSVLRWVGFRRPDVSSGREERWRWQGCTHGHLPHVCLAQSRQDCGTVLKGSERVRGAL